MPSSRASTSASDDDTREFCCPGCEAVSRSIAALGLDNYYRLRDAAPARIVEQAPEAATFDDPSIRQRYVTPLGDGIGEAQLLIEGMRCVACAWLIEETLLRVDGVKGVAVRFAARRVTVRWNESAAPPSALIEVIRRVGYIAWPFDEPRSALIEAGERRTLLRRLWIAGLAMMQVMMYAVPEYLASVGELTTDASSLMRWAGLLLTLPVLLYSAIPFFAGAMRDLRVRTLGMDVPIGLGLVVAFGASTWATVAGDGPVYFDSIAMFVFLLLAARYLEMSALDRAGQALAGIGRVVPEQARRLLRPGDLATDTVLAMALVRGDRVLVRPGETIPADAVLESEVATVSEAWMTGESRPVVRRRGDAVRCGSVNAGSALIASVTETGAATSMSVILRLIERSLGERPQWIASAERVVPMFVAAVLVTALTAFGAWLLIDPSRALWVAVAVLIVTCPCALALATPVAMTVATGALARTNVAVTRGYAIEAFAAVTDVVFDKTGTLTRGELALVDIVPLGHYAPDDALRLASALAAASSHPLDVALRRAAKDVTTSGSSAHVSVPGEGVEAIVDGVRCRLGRRAFVGVITDAPAPADMDDSVDSIAWLSNETGWIAAFRFRDRPRPDAKEAVARLNHMGIKLHILSGDDDAIVRAIADDLGIAQVRSRATPDDKCAFVRELQAGGARVAMVGDGINDAPVLAQADVSIAMHSGADLARIRADAVLLSDQPSDIVGAIRIARRTRTVIRQNLGWALGYNLVVVPLAAMGHLSPLIAGIGMSLSSLLVVANSLRAR